MLQQALARAARPTAALLLAGGAVARADDCTLRLAGHVVDPYEREALPDAHVTVEGPEGMPRTTHTTPTGDFVVGGLCPGPHVLAVSLHGFEELRIEVDLPSRHLDLVLEEDLEEIVVAVERLGREDTRAATTVSGAELEATRGRDLAGALEAVPGVATLGGSSATSQPIVRGQWGRRLLVLVDGVRHASQKWGPDHGTEVDPFQAGAITVVRGAAGVRYGPEALGGAIVLTPRPLRTDPGVDAETHLVGGTNGARALGALRVDGMSERTPGLAWRIEGNLARSQDQRAPGYVLGNTASRTWNLGATLGWHGQHVDLQVSYRRHDLAAGVFYGLRSETPDALAESLVRERPVGADTWTAGWDLDRPRQEVAHDQVLARAAGHVDELGTVTATYSFQHDARREYEPVRDADEADAQFDFQLATHQLDLTFAHVPVPVGRGFKAEGTVGAWGQAQENVYRGLPLVPNFASGNVGVFAIERFWHRDVEVEIGGRYDHRSQTTYLTDDAFGRHVARGTLDPDACAVGDDVAACPDSWNAGSVSVGALWRAWLDRLHLKLDLSSASRFPDADELFLNGSAPTFPVYGVGNPSLGPETTWSGSLTATLTTDWVRGEASGFVSYVQDHVRFAPELRDDGTPVVDVLIRGAFPRYGTSAVDAVFYGFDGAVAVAPDWHVRLDLGASIVRAEIVGGGFLPFVPPDRLRAVVTGQLPDARAVRDSYIAVRGAFVARQDRWDATTDLAPTPDAYALLGLAAGTTFHVREQTVGVAFEADNLLDTAYRDATSLLRYYADEPGRDLRLRISAQLGF